MECSRASERLGKYKAVVRLIAFIGFGWIICTDAQAQNATSWLVPPAGQVCTSRASPSNGVDYTSTSTFTGLVDGNYCFQIQNQRSGTTRTCVNGDGNPVEINGWKRTPHSGFYSWPLTVGKEWEFTYLATSSSGATSSWIKHVKIVSYEKILAGGQQYNAFKIEATNTKTAGGYV